MRTLKKLMAVLVSAGLLSIAASAAWAEEMEPNAENNLSYSGSFEVAGISRSINNDWIFGILPTGLFPVNGSVLNLRSDFSLTIAPESTVKWRLNYVSDTLNKLPGSFDLSRGFIDWTKGSLSLRLGKQRLAWGTGYAWNPTDILDVPRNPFDNADDPQGKMAMRADANFGPVTGQVFLVEPTDPNSGWDKAVRVKFSPGGFDYSLGYIKPVVQPEALSGDFAYSLSGVGLHGEMLYQWEGNERSDKGELVNYLVGCDYSFANGLYAALEYYHNDQGFDNVDSLKTYVFTHGTDVMQSLAQWFQQGGALQDHLFLRFTKDGIFEGLNGDLMFIHNLADGSVIAQPQLEYELNQNTVLLLKGTLTIGSGNVEANLLPAKDSITLGTKVNF